MIDLDLYPHAMVKCSETGKPIVKVTTEGTEALSDYCHAMVMDPETGKPMMKVHLVGGSGNVDTAPIIERLSVVEGKINSIEISNAAQDAESEYVEGVLTKLTNVGHALDVRTSKLEDSIADLIARVEALESTSV